MYLRTLLIALTATTLATQALASDTNTQLKISRPGDTELSCGALSSEATLMRDIINTTQDLQDNSKLKSRSAAVAGTAASFLIGTATGGIGLAAAGFFVDESLSGNMDETDKIQDTAKQRRSFVMGIHNAKGCHGPLDHALQTNNNKEKLASIEPTSGEISKNYND